MCKNYFSAAETNMRLMQTELGGLAVFCLSYRYTLEYIPSTEQQERWILYSTPFIG